MMPRKDELEVLATRRQGVLAALEASAGGVVVACDHAGRTNRARTLLLDECLRTVAPHRIVDIALAAGGAVLDLAQCPAAAGRAELAELAQLTDLVRLAGEASAVTGVEKGPLLDERRPPVDRRAALGLRRPPRATVGHHAAGADEHMMLVDSLRAATVDGGELPSPALQLVASGCIACGVCVRACPHDALVLTHDGAIATLTHELAACRGERQCIRHCPVDALSVAGAEPWSRVLAGERVELAEAPTRACPKCRTRFADDGPELCPQCRARERDPFGVHLPPEVLARLGRRPDGRRIETDPEE